MAIYYIIYIVMFRINAFLNLFSSCICSYPHKFIVYTTFKIKNINAMEKSDKLQSDLQNISATQNISEQQNISATQNISG